MKISLIAQLTVTILLLASISNSQGLTQETGLEPIVIPTDQYDDEGNKVIPKTEAVLKEEYKKCNKALPEGMNICVAIEECCYFKSYDPLVDEETNKCVSLDAYVRYTIRNPEKYLQNLGVSRFHNRISMNTFCEVLEYDSKITKLRNCGCRRNQIQSEFMSIAQIGLALVFSVLVFGNL